MKKTDSKSINECSYCAIPIEKILKCSKCLDTVYCSKECQKDDWKNHKNLCITLKKSIESTECKHLIRKQTPMNCGICKTICCCLCQYDHIKKFHPETIDKCIICLDTIIESDLFTLDCYHQFHKNCITELIKTTNKCPTCRLDLSVTPQKILSDILNISDKISTNDTDIEYNNILLAKLIKSFDDIAERNNSYAQLCLGYIYEAGIGVKQDYKMTFKYMLKASEQDNVTALYELGMCYYYGNGCIQDFTKAFKYYEKAAIKNYKDAQNCLGMLYIYGHGVTQNIKKGLYYLELASKQNDKFALFNIGIIYYSGMGVTKNIKIAIKYLKKAAEKNHVQAQVRLGIIYGEYKNYIMSFEYYKCAADNDDSNAQYVLGFYYKNGLGIKKNHTKALEYIIKSYKQDNVQAIHELGILYNYGICVEQDYTKAFEYFKRGSDLNYPRSQYKIAMAYEYGNGVKQDYNMAMEYYNKAADQDKDDEFAQFAKEKIEELTLLLNDE